MDKKGYPRSLDNGFASLSFFPFLQIQIGGLRLFRPKRGGTMMKESKRRFNILLSFSLTIALMIQVPLYAVAETEQGGADADAPLEEGIAGTEEAASEHDASGETPGSAEAPDPAEAPDLETPVSEEPEADAADEQNAVTEPAEEPPAGTEAADDAAAEETGTDEEASGFTTLAAPDLDGALVSITSALDPKKCLDIQGKSEQLLAPLILWPQVHTPNPRFKLVEDTNNKGYYTIVNLKSGLLLDIEGNSAVGGTRIIQYKQTGGNNQKWKPIANNDSSGSYTFVSKLDKNLCLDLSGSKTGDGTALIVSRCDSGKKSQRFVINKITSSVLPSGVYTVQSSASSKLLDISGASFNNSTAAICYTANTEPNKGLNQRFLFTYNQKTGYYTITSVNSNKMLDVSSASHDDGASVIQYAANGNYNQQWAVVTAPGGYYLYAAHSGKNLDLEGGKTADSTPVITWSFHGKANQQWKLTKAMTVDEGLRTVVTTAGRSLDIRGNSEANSAEALLYTPNGNLNQKFLVKSIGTTGTTYILECARSGKLLSAGSATGNQVYQYADQGKGSGNAYQQWVVEPAGNASFRLKNVATGKYLDCGSGASGTSLRLASSSSFSSQAWKFSATDPLPDGLYVLASALNKSLVLDIASLSLEPGVALALWTANDGANQTFKITKLGTGRYSIANLNSGLALDVDGGSINSKTGAGTVIQWNPQSGNNNQVWRIDYVRGGNFRFVSVLQKGRACMTVANSKPANGTSVGLLDINGSATQGFKPIPTGSISYYQMNYTLDQFVSWQIGTASTLKPLINPANKSGYSFMQFADVRVGSGVTGAQLNAFIDSQPLGQKGIFHGRGQAFVDAAKKYGINEVYFLAHAILESAWGTSNFAKGNYYDGHKLGDGKTYPKGTYYNFWGIGAYDSNPNYAIDYAVMHGWSSPEKAIDGSAQWIASNYIYGDYPQPTVYAMRWDYARSNAQGQRGWHQYATSLTWQNSIPRIMNDCYNHAGVSPNLYYVVPRFK
jgi:beta-N-acetylglucosaminidase